MDPTHECPLQPVYPAKLMSPRASPSVLSRHALWIALVVSLCGCSLQPQRAGDTGTGTAELPPECESPTHGIVEHTYSRMGYEGSACRLATISPDGSTLAYLTLEPLGPGDPPRDVQEVVKLKRDGYPVAEIYRSVLYHIHSMAWSSDSRLAFSDGPIEGSLGTTLIYDPGSGGITHRLRGVLRERGWSPDSSAFYLVLPLGIYGPICDYEFSGFDFRSDRPFPDVKANLAQKDGLVVEGAPQWTEGGRALLLVVRRSRWDETQEDFLLGPSAVLRVRTGAGGPTVEILHEDPGVDYALEVEGSEKVEILSQPYQPLYCRES